MTTRMKRANLIGSIDSLLAEVGSKQAAEANTEAGGYQGGTTHPVKDVEDRTEDAQEGARSAENTEDAKTEPNRGQPVDSTSEGPGAGQDSVQMDIGITSKATGEDSSSETDSAKGGKQDGGFQGASSHPARTDNDELSGGKYASDYEQFTALCKKAEDIGTKLLAAIAVQANSSTAAKQATAQPAAKQAESEAADPKGAGNTNSNAGGVGVKDGPITTEGKVNAKDESGGNAAKESADAGQQGYDLAGIFANQDIPVSEKQALDNMVVSELQEIVRLAESRAVKVAQFLEGHFQQAERARQQGTQPTGTVGKQAEDEGGERSEDKPPQEGGGEGGGDGGGAPPSSGDGGGGGGGALGGDDELLAMLMGGGGGAGGPPGGDPGAGAGGGAAGGIDPQQLLQILQQLGIDPQMLDALIAGGGAGAGGPPGGEGAGAPPPAAGGGDPLGGAGGPPGGGMPGMMGGKAAAAKSASHEEKTAAVLRVLQEVFARANHR